MRSLNKGTSPLVTFRAPLPLLKKAEARRARLGLTHSEFLRRAVQVAVGELCCIDPTDVFSYCVHNKAGRP